MSTVGLNGQTVTLVPWIERADELAHWVYSTTVVRLDAFVEYYIDEGKVQKRWVREKLTLERIARHFRATSCNGIISLATAVREPGGGSTCIRELVADIDCHDARGNHTATYRAGLAWFEVARNLGFHVILEHSSINSYHLRIIFNQDLEAGKARALGLWLTRDWKDHGLDRGPEIFPKRDELSPPGSGYGSFGGAVRLFGRYPAYESWSKVWDGSKWLDDDESIDWILNTVGDDPGLIPDAAIRYKEERNQERKYEVEEISEEDRKNKIEQAKAALEFLGADYYNDHDQWIRIGMSCHHLGDAMFPAWEKWSEKSDKFRNGECGKRWKSFSEPSDERGVTIGTLFHAAIEHGYKFPKPTPTRPEIEITTERHLVRDEAIKALARDERIFLRGDALATVARSSEATKKLFGGHILRNANGAPSVNLINESRLGCLLTENASLFRWSKDRSGNDISVACHPPDWLIAAVLSHKEYSGFRPLLTVAECPYVGLDGSIISRPGYDETTGTVLIPPFVLLPIPEKPSKQEAIDAWGRLNWLVREFPWASGYDTTVWLTALLTAIQRPAIAGCVPGFAFNGNKAGCGKGLAIDAIGYVAWGGPVPCSQYPDDTVEAEKVVLSIAIDGIAAVHFDNVEEGNQYGNGAIDSALTCTIKGGRPLGQSRWIRGVALRPCWFLSGNNISPARACYEL